VRNREAVVDATLDLLREGDVKPRAADIALRADVSVRTVFRLFEDLDQMFAAAADSQARRTSHIFLAPAPTGACRARVRALAEHRATLYEEIGPVRRAALRSQPLEGVLQRRIAGADRLLRQQLTETFRTELDEVGAGRRATLMAGLEMLTSFSAWTNLRSDQCLSVTRSKEVVVASLLALLAEADHSVSHGRVK
jgi:TetR/AcrR family transcriptional regulator, regulator of autoinduction and epiphytic fitness